MRRRLEIRAKKQMREENRPRRTKLNMNAEHISDHNLERYCIGMVTEEEELAPLEEHLLWCPACVERAEETQDYVDAMRVAAYDDPTYAC
jgi:hypothetical protein